MSKKPGLPALLLGAVLALSPAAALAAGRDGHGGGGGRAAVGRSSGGFGRGGHAFAGREGHWGGERHFDHDDRYYRGGRYFYGRPSVGFGFYGAPYYYDYGYVPGYDNPCDPGGYYDAYGNWIPAPGCYINPYGY